jgi:hypothetical protein
VPSVSAKQKRLMDAAAHNPEFAKKVGVPVKVAKEFSQADKGRKFSKGGDMKNTSRMNKLEEMGRLNAEKAYTSKGKKNLSAEKQRVLGDLKGMKKGGKTGYASGGLAAGHKAADGIAKKGKTKAMQVKMAGGGPVAASAKSRRLICR